MLAQLSIKNYALIDHLNVSFNAGFTIITGETGAGKSILLGGLSLVLGKRADLSSLREKDHKCIIEAEFKIDQYDLKSFFTTNDLDYEANTIIRREILPSGKSRAFVNDSPVNLAVLSQLGENLIDVHSQHQTLRLTENDFQFKVLDALADNETILQQYAVFLDAYKKTSKELQELVRFKEEAVKEQDYDSFLLQELEGASLELGIQESLEIQFEQLNNVELILEQLSKGYQVLNDEQIGALNIVSELKQISIKLSTYGDTYVVLNERIQSIFLEIDDISNEFLQLQESIEANPQQLEEVNTKLQLLYNLQKKHKTQDISDLVSIKDDLRKKVDKTAAIEQHIGEKEIALERKKEALDALAEKLRDRREKIIPNLSSQLEESLKSLGMENATFSITLVTNPNFLSNGKDILSFLFSANKGTAYGDLKKVASGGELSRIMLAIKSILAQYVQLPTMMFDEIDTGVSGEISNRMGEIMKGMSSHMQIFSITHLPQVASKGNHHYKVYKEDIASRTHTKMKKLESEDRIVELAEMLGGKELSDSAIAHAKQLLE